MSAHRHIDICEHCGNSAVDFASGFCPTRHAIPCVCGGRFRRFDLPTDTDWVDLLPAESELLGGATKAVLARNVREKRGCLLAQARDGFIRTYALEAARRLVPDLWGYLTA